MAIPVTLRVFEADRLVATREFHRDIIKIGRLSSAHLCLTDDKVSRIHAVIEVGGDGSISVIDMGSVDGTWVNGRKVNKGPLKTGDEIRVGNTRIRVDIGAASTLRPVADALPEFTPSEGMPLQPAATSRPAVTPSGGIPLRSPWGEGGPTFEAAAMTPLAPASLAPQEPDPFLRPKPTPTPKAQVKATPPPPPDEPEGEAAMPISAWWAADEEWPYWDSIPRPEPLPAGVAGPLDLEVRFVWGNQQLAASSFTTETEVTVGGSKDADFHVEGDKLPASDFTLLRQVEGRWYLAFTQGMDGELIRGGQVEKLSELAKARKTRPAGHDGAQEIHVPEDASAWVDLGRIRADISHRPRPRPAFVPLFERIDYTFANLVLLMLFLAVGGIVAFHDYASDIGDTVADDLFTNPTRFTKLLLQPPERKKNAFLDKLDSEKLEKPQASAGDAGTAGTPRVKPDKPARSAPRAIDPNDKDAVKRKGILALLGSGQSAGLSTIFGKAGLGGELQGALGGLTGAVGDAHGLGGLTLKGAGLGGGGVGTTIGVGDVGTKGRGGGIGDYGAGAGDLGKKGSADVAIDASDAVIMGSLDKELIRRVIQSHRSQIRYCYESELVRDPKLKGKIAVRFTITGNGTVSTAATALTTMNDASVESCLNARVKSWLFPKPKGGGIVIVTYPFVFTRPGE